MPPQSGDHPPAYPGYSPQPAGGSGDLRSQLPFTEPVPKLPQGSRPGGPIPPAGIPAVRAILAYDRGWSGEQHPDQRPPAR
jgi:hypothetical protein